MNLSKHLRIWETVKRVINRNDSLCKINLKMLSLSRRRLGRLSKGRLLQSEWMSIMCEDGDDEYFCERIEV